MKTGSANNGNLNIQGGNISNVNLLGGPSQPVHSIDLIHNTFSMPVKNSNSDLLMGLSTNNQSSLPRNNIEKGMFFMFCMIVIFERIRIFLLWCRRHTYEVYSKINATTVSLGRCIRPKID